MKVCRSKTEYMRVNDRKGDGVLKMQGVEIMKVTDTGKILVHTVLLFPGKSKRSCFLLAPSVQ